MSPLDIPTIIPSSTVSESEILERVSKFFWKIGEVTPSEGPVKPSDSANDYDDYKREPPDRKGGACLPPPSNLQADPETGTYPDGSVEQKPCILKFNSNKTSSFPLPRKSQSQVLLTVAPSASNFYFCEKLNHRTTCNWCNYRLGLTKETNCYSYNTTIGNCIASLTTL